MGETETERSREGESEREKGNKERGEDNDQGSVTERLVDELRERESKTVRNRKRDDGGRKKEKEDNR